MEATETISEYELERGKPMPSTNHSFIQLVLGSMFLRYSKQFTFLSEVSLKLGEFRATPDISVYPKFTINWLHDEIKKTKPPLLVVEIISPMQGMQDVIDKIEKYFENGVKSCWLVLPAIQSNTVFKVF